MGRFRLSIGKGLLRQSLLAVALWFGLLGRVSADAGTPLMWAPLLHLVFGNTLLAIVETALLVLLFKRRPVGAFFIMLASNYVSAMLGAFFIGFCSEHLHRLDLYSAWRWFWVMAALCYFITLVVEWPFTWACWQFARRDWKVAVRATFLVQTVSYLLLFGGYWSFSGTHLYRDFHMVPATSLSLPKNLTLIYLSTDQLKIMQQPLGSSAATQVLEIPPANGKSRVRLGVLFHNAATAPQVPRKIISGEDLVPHLDDLCELVFVREREQGEVEDAYLVWRRFANLAAGSPILSLFPNQLPKTNVLTLDRKMNSWQISTGSWPNDGVFGHNLQTGEDFWLNWETLFGAWMVSDVIYLPGDILIFQLGEDQICTLDIPSHQVALLARGSNPVVARLAPDALPPRLELIESAQMDP